MLAQVPGADTLVQSASQHSWEAAAVAIVLTSLLVGIGWLMRALWNINQRLADRVTSLESMIHERVMTIVENTSATISANTQMLSRTADAIDKLEAAVENSIVTQQKMMARIEASPCLMDTALSEETRGTLERARRAAIEGSNDNG